MIEIQLENRKTKMQSSNAERGKVRKTKVLQNKMTVRQDDRQIKR